ncbi:hypothetical protein BT63DRAFT_11200 [Microthyrium microscopicum]|uniref:F-box domain-containing protein n=1 Tax=Microthyrium microscopicum TaxID=703497 RepID=A0A6A6URU4_9PEZI|nr:hypothetical protein BT63DRAFT_11200 [Microthyrium microscopicum]
MSCCYIGQLPLELLQEITSYLDTCDEVMLGCTSKWMFLYVGPEPFVKLKTSMSSEDRKNHLRFLFHFDGSLPDMILCHKCHSYHPRNRGRELSKRAEADSFDIHANNYDRPSRTVPSHPKCQNFMPYVDRHWHRQPGMYCTWSRTLWWKDAFLMLRANKYGPSFGQPATAIDCRPEDNPQKINGWAQIRSAKMVQDHLLIKMEAYSLHKPGENTITSADLAELMAVRRDLDIGGDFVHGLTCILQSTALREAAAEMTGHKYDGYNDRISSHRNESEYQQIAKLPLSSGLYRCPCCPCEMTFQTAPMETMSPKMKDMLTKDVDAVTGDQNSHVRVFTRYIDYGKYSCFPSPEYEALHQESKRWKQQDRLPKNLQDLYEAA